MNSGPIIQHVQRLINLNDEELNFFVGLLQARQFPRKSFFLREEEICTDSAFVVSGCFRAYSIDESGAEHILQFAPSNWWITDMYSLLAQKPARLHIEALEDTEAFVLSKVNQDLLYKEVPKFERYFRILLENSLVASRQRVLDNLELTAMDRYAKFCNTYPGLVNSIPQKQIAAYIGVTPEFLSKMKAEYWRNHS
jgi:CRP-like cAMP-binding protein